MGSGRSKEDNSSDLSSDYVREMSTFYQSYTTFYIQGMLLIATGCLLSNLPKHVGDVTSNIVL